MNDFIPVAEPDLSIFERNNLLEAFDSGWISSTGKFVDQFEEQWSISSGSKHSLAVANGTVALHLILAALGVGPGDEVIVPSLTFIATANAVKYVGAEVVFADSNQSTWNIDLVGLVDLITPKTKAIIAVHLYGNPSDMENLEIICNENNLFLIEDAAEAPFATIGNKPIGSFGIAASFSFYGNKILTSGEGGVVTTSDTQLYKKMKLLRGQGMDPNQRYYFTDIGYNFRLTNMQCAILCAQLERKEELLSKRKRIYDVYDEILSGHPNLKFQEILPNHIRSPWLYSLVIDGFPLNIRDSIARDLLLLKIETRPLFIPLHLLPPYESEKHQPLPISVKLGAQGLSLPTSSKMLPESAEEIANYLLEVLKKY